MPDIYQLEHLISIAEHGTLSKAAEELHLSQSALSRSMQKLESDLQVTLFEHTKNKVELNQNGKLAVECARKVIAQMQDMTEKIRIFDRNSRTISVGSCAPAGCDSHTVQRISRYDHFLRNERTGQASAGLKGWHLSAHHHFLPGRRSRRFLQDDDYVFRELVNASALPCFTSDIMIKRYGKPSNRIIIPILDDEAHVCYFLSCLSEEKEKLSAFFRSFTVL